MCIRPGAGSARDGQSFKMAAAASGGGGGASSLAARSFAAGIHVVMGSLCLGIGNLLTLTVRMAVISTTNL
jgi:hypothetical protein